jgi:hypothetical protein
MVFSAIVLGRNTEGGILNSFIVTRVTHMFGRDNEAEANSTYDRIAIDSTPEIFHKRRKHRIFDIPCVSQLAKHLKMGGISITGRSAGNDLATDTRRKTTGRELSND